MRTRIDVLRGIGSLVPMLFLADPVTMKIQ